MILHVLRGLFILLMAAVGWFYLQLGWLTMAITLGLGMLFVGVDVLSPRRKLAIFSGTLFGLAVGMALSYALGFVVQLIVDQAGTVPTHPLPAERLHLIAEFAKLVVAIVTCYLSISFTLQTKDDFRFIIPYVEFSKKTKGDRPLLLDTSALIDGRIADIAATGIIESQVVVPQFVLQELQHVADSGDKLKRNRGRRGLDVLARLRNEMKKLDVVLYDGGQPDRPAPAADLGGTPGTTPVADGGGGGVDQLLMDLAEELNGRVLTNDYNLNKIAQLRGVDVINVNDLAAALKPVVLPGERMGVRLVKPGEAAGQGVGYLDDGTMVVVEGGRSHVNETVEFTVTSVLQTSAGRMIFGRYADAAPPPASPVRRQSAGRAD